MGSTAGQTIVEKIAQSHLAEGPDRPLRAGDFVSIRPRHVMTHDNTAPVIEKFRAIGAPSVLDPGQPVFVLDHDIQNRSEPNLAKYRAIEAFARQQGVDFYAAGSGIGHQIMLEQLYVVPGSFVVASDSHANMYGAIGAIGTPVVRTDAAAIWATGTFWWQIPRSVQVHLSGKLSAGACGKDVIIALCGLYSRGEVLNAAVEFTGPGVTNLSVEERMSISNMTTEWGALVGWFPADAQTVEFVAARCAVPGSTAAERIGAGAVDRILDEATSPDADAAYAARIRLDLSQVSPHVAGPDTVRVATPLAELERRNISVQKAYLVSCVNSRADDISAAAAVLEGRKVAEGVELYIAAASREVEQESRRRGSWQTLLEAGARPLPPGCGPCIGLGAGLLEAGEVGISATNRNFKGRMGSRDARCYLASPAVVAASAAAGRICGPGPDGRRAAPERSYEAMDAPPTPAESVEILTGFPERVRGRLVFLPRDNLDTDGIYGKDYTYRDDVTRERMAQVVFENYDPTLAATANEGDVIVAGWNFGTGSSREQAVTALQAKGIAMVIAASYSQTYLRNAFNNGFPCIACPELVGRIRELTASRIETEKTIVPGDEIEVDFASGTVTFRSTAFRFPTLGKVPQALVVAGGVEKQVRQRLGLG